MRVIELMTPAMVTAQASQSVAEACVLFRLYRVEHLPVLAGAVLRGVIGAADVRRLGTVDAEVLASVCLDDLLATSRRTRAIVASPLTTVEEARILLDDWPEGCLLVQARDGELLGLVSGRDLDGLPSRGESFDPPGRLEPRAPLDLPARELVTDAPVSVRLLDLSTTGALVSSAGRPPPLGALVVLEWSLGGEDAPLSAEARVVRHAGRGAPGPHAVELVSVTHRDRERIAAWVETVLAPGRPARVQAQRAGEATTTRSRPSSLAR